MTLHRFDLQPMTSEQLVEALETMNTNAHQLSLALQVTPAAVAHWKSGRRDIPLHTAFLIRALVTDYRNRAAMSSAA